MRSVTVNAPSGQYEVKIGAGLLPLLGSEVRACTRAKRCAVIAGENVFPLYGEIAMTSLRTVGLEARPLVFHAGEQTKCLGRYGELLSFLAENRFTLQAKQLVVHPAAVLPFSLSQHLCRLTWFNHQPIGFTLLVHASKLATNQIHVAIVKNCFHNFSFFVR